MPMRKLEPKKLLKKYALKNPCSSAMNQSTTVGCEKEPQMANMHQTPSDASGVEIAKAK